MITITTRWHQFYQLEIVELSLTWSVDLLVELSVGRYPEFFSCFYTSKWIVTFTITLLSTITDFSFSFLSFFSHIKYVSEKESYEVLESCPSVLYSFEEIHKK